ncbi:MAG: FkbM family methyltransferase [Planctomycetota bacterium]|jgi:FkbM family methyltransferase|nr:FkbM family methyltransferase [Planctomycetota bacterium]
MEFISQLREDLRENSRIEPLLREFFLSPREAVIYGGGTQSKVAREFCAMFEKKVARLVVSPGEKIPGIHVTIPAHEIAAFPPDLDKNAYDVVIAVNEKYNREILDILRDSGFSRAFYSGNWFVQNELVRNLWYEAYFRFHGAAMRHDGFGNRYLEYRFGGGNLWKLYYPENNPLVVSNSMGVMNDLILPPLFGDLGYVTEGPYEYGGGMKENDVVFDLGANVGLFSTVALAKECTVHAFEPTPFTLEILKKNLSLYDGGRYEAYPWAVTDRCGKAVFNVNDDFSRDYTLGVNSMLERKGFKQIEVDTVSLDAFVDENGIDRVDFIKADIEGAERLMLAGAKKTLARFAPKLALCTYHLPDDPEVMERLILEANPKYIIEHKWEKLYAYCR